MEKMEEGISQRYLKSDSQKEITADIRTIRELFEWAEKNGLADCPIGLQYQDMNGLDCSNTFEDMYWYRDPDTKVVKASKEVKRYCDHIKNSNFRMTEHIDYVLLT